MLQNGMVSVVRHGATRYTKKFPDLVAEGLPALKAAGKEIGQRFSKRPIFVASPADRAVATALHIMEECGFGRKKEDIKINELLRPILIFDHEAFDRKFFSAHPGGIDAHMNDPLKFHSIWDRFYMESDVFENGEFCEPRSSAKNRFIEFLKQLPILYGTELRVVAVTHLEVVGPLIHEWFEANGNYFNTAEAVHFNFLKNGQLQAEFRGEKKILPVPAC